MVLGTTDGIEENGSIKAILNDIIVHEIMTKNVFTIDIASTTLEIAGVMNKQNVDSIIVTKDGEATGIITERDMVYQVMTKDVLPSTIQADVIMSAPILSIKPDTDVIKASEIMVKSHVRRLVVADGKDIVGLVTDRDILTIAPGLNTILEDLIEINREQDVINSIDIEREICQQCGAFVEGHIQNNGSIVCEDCREENYE